MHVPTVRPKALSDNKNLNLLLHLSGIDWTGPSLLPKRWPVPITDRSSRPKKARWGILSIITITCEV